MSDLFGRLKSGANKVAFEADKMARVNRAQGELEKLKGQVGTNFAKLGEIVYRQYNNKEAVSPELEEICKAVAEIEQQVGVKTEEIAKIKAETFGAPAAAATAAPQAPAPAASTAAPAPAAAAPTEPAPQAESALKPKFCTNCGKEVPAGAKFCTECGTPA